MKIEDFVSKCASEGSRVLTESTKNPNCGVYLRKGRKNLPCLAVAVTQGKDYFVLTLEGETAFYRASEIS